MAQKLDVSCIAVGVRVLNEAEREFVSGPDWPRVFLPAGYPGVVFAIYGPGLNHVVVEWLYLENHPESYAMGHDHDADGRYNLLLPEESEWDEALRLATASGLAEIGWSAADSA